MAITEIDLKGKVLKPDIIYSNCIIRNAVIEANPFVQIFDLTVTLVNCKCREFSTAWFGAKSSIADNSDYLLKASDTCIANGISNLFVADNYTYSKSWYVSCYNGTSYVGFGLNIYGQGDMWNQKTVLTYTGSWLAFGVQMAKGGSIKNVSVKSTYIPPKEGTIAYYNTPFPEKLGHRGIVVDYDGTHNLGGSSGFVIENTCVSGFDTLYSISPANTFNADMIQLNRIQCGHGRKGVEGNQAQEKGNEINYISSWGNIHKLLQLGVTGKAQGGGWVVRGGNIAGFCVQLLDISLGGWNGLSISGIWAEGLGRIGSVMAKTDSYLPTVSIRDMTVRYALPEQAGKQTLFIGNSPKIVFRDCNLWYYRSPSTTETQTYSGVFTMDNCDTGKNVINILK